MTETDQPGWKSTNALPGFNAVKLTNNKIKVSAFAHTNYPNNDFLDCSEQSCIFVTSCTEPEICRCGDPVTITTQINNYNSRELTDITVMNTQAGDLTDQFIAANGGTDCMPVGGCVKFQAQYQIPMDAVGYTVTQDGGEVLDFTTEATGIRPDLRRCSDSDGCDVIVTGPPNPGRRCFLPVTFTQQGWSDNCDVMIYNAFHLAFANFTYYGTTYPNRLIVGGRYTITYEGTTGGLLRLCLFLPQTGPCGKLRRNYVNPWDTTEAGALAGETVALMMNLAYNDERLMPRSRGYDLESFVVNEGLLRGCRVGQVLNIANQVLGGSPVCMFGVPDCGSLVGILQKINANYEWVDYDTFTDNGYLTPNRPFGQPDPPHAPVVPYQ